MSTTKLINKANSFYNEVSNKVKSFENFSLTNSQRTFMKKSIKFMENEIKKITS